MPHTPDYQQLIDPEVWEFIHRTNCCFPADAVKLSVQEQRKIYTAMCQEFQHSRPAGIIVSDAVINIDKATIPVRRYSKKERASSAAHIIYMHGGGFVVGGLESHDDVCAELCDNTGLAVTSIDYRLAPEHKHPAAHDDCLAVVRHEANRLGCALVLCGDSAGATLCASVSHRLRTSHEPSPVIAQVLIYPALGTYTNTDSCRNHAHAPMLTLDDVKFYMNVRLSGALPTDDVSFAPLHDVDFADLPNTLVVSAECDPLCDDGKLYCAAITRAGGNARWVCEPGLVHGYLRARHTSKRAKASFQMITDHLKNYAIDMAALI